MYGVLHRARRLFWPLVFAVDFDFAVGFVVGLLLLVWLKANG
jgi:hypothetical protein